MNSASTSPLSVSPRGCHASVPKLVRYLIVAAMIVVMSAVAAPALAATSTPSLYVSNSYGFGHPARLTGYVAGASGNTAPVTDVVGQATGLYGSVGVARARSGSVWVANSFTDTLTAYGATADGNVRPIATISGADTGLAGPQGIAFDPAGRPVVANNGHGSSVTEYAAGANGNVTPATTISGPDTGLSDPAGLAFDANGNLFVSNSGNDSVTEYAPGASGDAQPMATLTGAATGLHAPDGLIFDTSGRLSVANSGSNTVTTYAPGATANATPVVTLGGAATKLSEPTGLGLDASGQLYVGNFSNLVTVFRRGAAGDATPVRTLAGTATALDGVNGLLVVSAPSATTLPTAGLSATTAELAGTVSPDGGPTSYYFQYGPTTAYGAKTVSVNAGAGPGPQNVFATITRLTPATVTHYRIVTTSPAGTVFGADRAFTTASAGPAATPMLYSSNAPALVYPGSNAPASILGFPVGSKGNLPPSVAISGPHTGLSAPVGVAVDAHGDVFTADFNGNQILEYGPGARGRRGSDLHYPSAPGGQGLRSGRTRHHPHRDSDRVAVPGSGDS